MQSAPSNRVELDRTAAELVTWIPTNAKELEIVVIDIVSIIIAAVDDDGDYDDDDYEDDGDVGSSSKFLSFTSIASSVEFVYRENNESKRNEQKRKRQQ